MKITVFVKSLAYAHHPERQIHNTNPYYGMAVEQTFVEAMDWDARLFSPDDRKILNRIGSLPEAARQTISVVDISQFRGRMRAWRAGVLETPAMVANGRHSVRYNAVIGVLDGLAEKAMG